MLPGLETALIDVAPGLLLTIEGQWVAEPPAGARVIAHLDLPAPDAGTRHVLLSKSEKSTEQEIIDTLGLWGDTRDLFQKAWKIGKAAYGIYSGYTWAIQAAEFLGLNISGTSGEMKALKEIKQLVINIDQKLTASINYNTAYDRGKLDGKLDKVEEYIQTFLVHNQEGKALATYLEDAHEESKPLLDRNYQPDVMFAFFQPFQLHKDAPWIWTMTWGYEQHPLYQDKGVHILGAGYPATRWDCSGWLPLIARTITLLITGHMALDPTRRTSGMYRSWFLGYADGLRALAEKMEAGIQLTRPFSLQHDTTTDFFQGTINYNQIAWGWPVGAVDSILAASIIDPVWKPAEDGFPILAELKDKKFPLEGSVKPPPPPYTWSYQLAVAKADQRRTARWWQLYATHPVVHKLRALAALLEDMATPPQESETVRFEKLEWLGMRVPQGEETQTVGGGQRLCDERQFTADVYHVERRGKLHTQVQRDLFRWSGHIIRYRFAVESHVYHATEPNQSTLVDRVVLCEFDENWDAVGGPAWPLDKTINLKVSTFSWNIQRPLHAKLSESLEAESNVHYVMQHPSPQHVLYDWYLPTQWVDVSTQPMRTAAVTSDPSQLLNAPIEERSGVAWPTGFRHMQFRCGLSHQDEKVLFEIENTIHPQQVGNALLWFIVEEEIGKPQPGMPAFIRSAYRMPVIGVEHYWPASYFSYLKHCEKRALETWKRANRLAQERGIPLPQPDPINDGSFMNYVMRILRHTG